MAQIQKAFKDAHTVCESKHRRLSPDGRLIGAEAAKAAGEADVADLPDDPALPDLDTQIDYKGHSRRVSVQVRRLQPARYIAKQILQVMNSEAYKLLLGYKELFGQAKGHAFEEEPGTAAYEERKMNLLQILEGLNPEGEYKEQSLHSLQKLYEQDFGGSLRHLHEALEWPSFADRFAMAADVPEQHSPNFEFSKPGRVYSQLVSQRLFLDFVRNRMKRPRNGMSYHMKELRHLMERINSRSPILKNMQLKRQRALLARAWPHIMAQGGLPVKAVALGHGLVYVPLIQQQATCIALMESRPREVAVGTTMVVILRKEAESLSAKPLAIKGWRVEATGDTTRIVLRGEPVPEPATSELAEAGRQLIADTEGEGWEDPSWDDVPFDLVHDLKPEYKHDLEQQHEGMHY